MSSNERRIEAAQLVFEQIWGFLPLEPSSPEALAACTDPLGVRHACDVSAGSRRGWAVYGSGMDLDAAAYACGCRPAIQYFKCGVCRERVGWCSGAGDDALCDACWCEKDALPAARRMLASLLRRRAGLPGVTYDGRLGRRVIEKRRPERCGTVVEVDTTEPDGRTRLEVVWDTCRRRRTSVLADAVEVVID